MEVPMVQEIQHPKQNLMPCSDDPHPAGNSECGEIATLKGKPQVGTASDEIPTNTLP